MFPARLTCSAVPSLVARKLGPWPAVSIHHPAPLNVPAHMFFPYLALWNSDPTLPSHTVAIAEPKKPKPRPADGGQGAKESQDARAPPPVVAVKIKAKRKKCG